MENQEIFVGRWISMLYRCRKGYASKKLEPYGIVGCQYLFLLALSHDDGASQEKISDFLKIDKTTTAKSIKKLEANGFVRRVKDDEDKRAYKVFLTQKAQDIVPQIKKTMREWEKIVTADISAEEYKELEAILKKTAMKAYDFGNS